MREVTFPNYVSTCRISSGVIFMSCVVADGKFNFFQANLVTCGGIYHFEALEPETFTPKQPTVPFSCSLL